MSNSLSGLGTAIRNDQEQFEILYEGSPRCRSLLSLAARAYALSNFDVLKAYTNIKDPGYWLTLADAEEDARVGRPFWGMSQVHWIGTTIAIDSRRSFGDFRKMRGACVSGLKLLA